MADRETLQTWQVAEPYLNIHCALGEGPYYEANTNTLRFVDIRNHRIHVIDISVGLPSLRTIQLDIPVGVTANINGVDPQDKILIGGKAGLAVLDRNSGIYKYLTRFHHSTKADDRMRSNDGAVDSEGRFWLGTMNDFHVGEPQAEGTVYRIDTNLTHHPMIHPVTIPNGMAWTSTNDVLLFTHSTTRTIYAYDFDAPSGHITNPRIFYRHGGPGEPDGMKMDRDGYVWQCVYGEGKVIRISPAGELVGEINLPTRNVTCPCFVGEELWITSALEDEPEKWPESARFGGALFRVHVGIEGVGEFAFSLGEDVTVTG